MCAQLGHLIPLDDESWVGHKIDDLGMGEDSVGFYGALGRAVHFYADGKSEWFRQHLVECIGHYIALRRILESDYTFPVASGTLAGASADSSTPSN